MRHRMRERVKALEDPNRGDQLAWLVLRVVAELSPCTERSLFGCVSGGVPASRPGQASYAHTRELIYGTLLKLKERSFIQLDYAQIAITDKGRRFLDELPVVAVGPDGRSVKTSKSWSDSFEALINGALRALPWTHYIGLSSEFAPTLLARCIPRLDRFCRDRFAGTGAVMQRTFLTNSVRARYVALEFWKRKVASTVGSRAATLVLILARLATVCRRHTEAAANVNRPAGVSRLVIFAGFVLLIALSTAGAVVFLSGKRAESTQASIVRSRASPVVWFFDEQDRPKQSIFVKRDFSGATWIEGISIRGANTSNQPLTAVQATLISDMGEEIELTLRAAGGRQAQVDVHDVPSESEFTLEHGFELDASAQRAGMPAEQFLSKYGGMIFRMRYSVAGVQGTLIDYFSPSRLKTDVVEAKSAEASQ